MSKYTTRTLLELTIGDGNLIVETLIRIRQKHLQWWNDLVKENERELFKLVTLEILPMECQNDIDRLNNGKRWSKKGERSENSIVIGEKNLASMTATSRRKGKKKQKRVAESNPKKIGNNRNKKSITGITYVFGETIQVVYKMEEISTSTSATLVFDMKTKVENETKNHSISSEANKKDLKRMRQDDIPVFKQVIKIPKRIVMWCSPFDPKHPFESHPLSEGGFPRPEYIPISSLFKEDNVE